MVFKAQIYKNPIGYKYRKAELNGNGNGQALFLRVNNIRTAGIGKRGAALIIVVNQGKPNISTEGKKRLGMIFD